MKKRWIDENNRITSTAFLYDPDRDPDGLSVSIASETNLEDWLRSFNKSFGSDSLHCGHVRKLGLEVGQTENDLAECSPHAVIVGLPTPDENPKLAEDIATELARISRKVDREIRKKA